MYKSTKVGIGMIVIFVGMAILSTLIAGYLQGTLPLWEFIAVMLVLIFFCCFNEQISNYCIWAVGWWTSHKVERVEDEVENFKEDFGRVKSDFEKVKGDYMGFKDDYGGLMIDAKPLINLLQTILHHTKDLDWDWSKANVAVDGGMVFLKKFIRDYTPSNQITVPRPHIPVPTSSSGNGSDYFRDMSLILPEVSRWKIPPPPRPDGLPSLDFGKEPEEKVEETEEPIGSADEMGEDDDDR